MKIVTEIEHVRNFIKDKKIQGQSIGFVPTMGALHKGHMSLIESSQQHCDVTVLSIYVNPTQFGPTEDLASYLRPIEDDKAMAKQYGVDLLFLPSDTTMYDKLQSITVADHVFSTKLCGAYRPGHFDGVCTIVAKLLNIVSPDCLFLGMKDAQQLRILQNMVDEIFFTTKVMAAKTVREDDGLACSSRNNYLSQTEREIAPTVFQALSLAKQAFQNGEHDPDKIIEVVKDHIATQPTLHPQYIELLDWQRFTKPQKVNAKSVLALACFLGSTRLIDNIILTP